MEEKKLTEVEATVQDIAQEEFDSLMLFIRESVVRHSDSESPSAMMLAVCVDVYNYGKNIGIEETTKALAGVLLEVGGHNDN